jgi:hypothetical protein
MAFDREAVKAAAADLAARGIYVGTSSWKYAGWLGQLYDAPRYEYRGKLAKTRFERDCLSQYSEVFKTVCVSSVSPSKSVPNPNLLALRSDLPFPIPSLFVI